MNFACPTLACPTGIEPVTPSLEGWCSIRLSYGHNSFRGHLNYCLNLVGVERFELPTSCSQSKRATRLRYTPKRRQMILQAASRGQRNPVINLHFASFRFACDTSAFLLKSAFPFAGLTADDA